MEKKTLLAVLIFYRRNRGEGYKMSMLYEYFGMTRQAASQACARYERECALQGTLVVMVKQIRSDHPRMGLRKIYDKLGALPIGRDRFEALMIEERLEVKRRRPAWKTTLSQSRVRLPNLLSGRVLNGMHQAWVSDITYFYLLSRFFYIVLIEDVYTRLILAAHVSRTLRAEANIAVLAEALETTRQEREGTITIHHSDKGSQYTDREYMTMATSAGMRLSMCDFAWENGYMERAIQTVKNEYLIHRKISSFTQIENELERTIRLYNDDRPHRSHPQRKTPRAFAEYVATLRPEDRPILQVYDSTDARGIGETAVPPCRCQEYTKPGKALALDNDPPEPQIVTRPRASQEQPTR